MFSGVFGSERTPLPKVLHAPLAAKWLARGADVSSTDAQDGRSALHWAALGGAGHLAALLLRAGADVRRGSATGREEASGSAMGLRVVGKV